MRIKMAYGKSGKDIELPDSAAPTVIESLFVPGLKDERNAILQALRQPLGALPLRESLRPEDTVSVVFSDLTRPMPNERVLPPLLEEIGAAGVPDNHVTLVNGLGTHRAETEAELTDMLGEDIMRRYRIVQHDAWNEQDLLPAGKNAFGRTVRVNRAYMESTKRILTGFIEPHLFAGFSGGPKAVLPAICDIDAIMDNHGARMIASPYADWAITQGNPIWEDMLSVAKSTQPHFMLNVTINRDRQITGVFAGDMEAAYQAGVSFIKQSALHAVNKKFDIVITSNSGYPLDLNLYQSAKGLKAANRIVKTGGHIILVAECWEGLPSHGEFGRLLGEAQSPSQLIDMISAPGFRCHDQWGVQEHAKILLNATIHAFSSGLSDEDMRRAMVKPCTSIEDTVRELLIKNPNAAIAVMPEGPQVLPFVKE